MKSWLDAIPFSLLDDLLRFCNVIVIVIVLVWLTFMSLYPIVDYKSDKKVNQTMTMTLQKTNKTLPSELRKLVCRNFSREIELLHKAIATF